jgi:predicted metal-dependent phosphotriesterase family hydrolase
MGTVLPFVQEVMQQRVKTFVDCTPAFLGRDVQLLQRLSERTGLQIITNTGYYGASKEKFIPARVYTLSPEAIAAEWIKEYEDGIEGTGIRPGFIKSGVDVFPLSKVQQKLVHAAAITHLKTGLPIAIHTGSGDAALEEIRILKAAGVDPVAYIWVHAQSEKEKKYHFKVAGEDKGWLSFDGVGPDSVDEYVTQLTYLKEANLLHRVLLSHDAGWYDVGGTEGSKYRRHTTIFTTLIPALQQKGFTEADIRQLLITNPANAFSIRVHKKA